MAILAQGTQIYYIDPDTDEVVEVDCATSFNPGGNPSNQLQSTCLRDSAHTYMPGLRTPSQATLGLHFDPVAIGDLQLFELSNANPSPTLQWAVGFSDGEGVPTVDSSGDFDFPTTRSFFYFDGYISDFAIDLQLDALVSAQVTIQRSGESTMYPRLVA